MSNEPEPIAIEDLPKSGGVQLDTTEPLAHKLVWLALFLVPWAYALSDVL